MEPIFNNSEAIASLYPTCKWTLRNNDYETLWWDDENDFAPPTLEELKVEIARLKSEYENNQYQRDRKKEYPSIEDQLDTLYHQGYDGWKASIDEVKNKYPRPGEE